MIRKASMEDLVNINIIYMKARKFMEATGNPDQWGKDRPSYESVVTDIKLERMYIIEEEGEILGVFSLYDYTDGLTRDEDYDNIQGQWLNDEPYVAIHKIASNGIKGGVFSRVLEFAKTKSNNIRIDTHKHNKIMQVNIKRSGFRFAGIVFIDGVHERVAYHLSL